VKARRLEKFSGVGGHGEKCAKNSLGQKIHFPLISSPNFSFFPIPEGEYFPQATGVLYGWLS